MRETVKDLTYMQKRQWEDEAKMCEDADLEDWSDVVANQVMAVATRGRKKQGVDGFPSRASGGSMTPLTT